MCLKDLSSHQSPPKKKSSLRCVEYSVFWSWCLWEGDYASSSHYLFTMERCPGFELIDVLKLSTEVQLAFHKIIFLMCGVLFSSFLKFSFLCNELGQRMVLWCNLKLDRVLSDSHISN